MTAKHNDRTASWCRRSFLLAGYALPLLLRSVRRLAQTWIFIAFDFFSSNTFGQIRTSSTFGNDRFVSDFVLCALLIVRLIAGCRTISTRKPIDFIGTTMRLKTNAAVDCTVFKELVWLLFCNRSMRSNWSRNCCTLAYLDAYGSSNTLLVVWPS